MQNIEIGDFGCIFAGLESLLLKQTDIAHSNSELFLKLFRSADPTGEYNSEHSFFRNIRKERLEQTELIDRLHSIGFDIRTAHLDHLHDVPAEEQGAWCLLHSLMVGMKSSSLKDPSVLKYLDFLLGHCQIERDLIKTLRTGAKQFCKEELAPWILLDSHFIGTDHAQDNLNHLASVIFYWTALYEKFLYLEYGDLDWKYTEFQSPSLILKYLPKTDKKGVKLINSTWCFIEEFKDYLPNKGNKKIFDAELYREICEVLTNLNSEPSEDAIQRNFKKIKSGEAPLTISFALEHLIPLTGRAVPPTNKWDTSLMIIHFLNLFTKIQISALNSGLAYTEVIEIFHRYPRYVDAVHSRFHNFEKTGILVAA